MNLSIHDVTKDNVEEIIRLTVAESQTNFIETTQQCLTEATECTNYKPVGLYMNEQLVGFAMYGYFPEEDEHGRLWLDRFLIDAKYQGLGLGTSLFKVLIQKLVAEFSCHKLYLSVVEDNAAALRLYEKFDFHFNGESDVNDEKIMVKNI